VHAPAFSRPQAFLLPAVLLASALIAPAFAIDRGTTPAGARFASGGVSAEELDTLRAEIAEKGRYTLWVTTAAKKSGAYMADVLLRVRDAKGLVLFERKLDGPWLVADLPAGPCTIEGEFGAEKQRATATLNAGALRQVVLYFNTGDELSPDRPEAPAAK
jgi:hypothetical protein